MVISQELDLTVLTVCSTLNDSVTSQAKAGPAGQKRRQGNDARQCRKRPVVGFSKVSIEEF